MYRLVDDGASLKPDSSGGWAGSQNPFDCGCTIATPLVVDTNNIYWGGETSAPATQKVWTLGQASRAEPTGAPFTITPVLTTGSPALWTSGATKYLFLATVGNLIKLDVTNQTLQATNTNPGSASVSRTRFADRAGRAFLPADDSGQHVGHRRQQLQRHQPALATTL